MRAERLKREQLLRHRGAVYGRKLRQRGLLRKQRLQRLRMHRGDVPVGMHGRLELRERLLLQHGDDYPGLRAKRPRRGDVFWDAGAVLERKLRQRGLLHEQQL